jgi:hypothetical protein
MRGGILPNTLVGPRFHDYSSCIDTHFDRAAVRILVAQVVPPMPSAHARLNPRLNLKAGGRPEVLSRGMFSQLVEVIRWLP